MNAKRLLLVLCMASLLATSGCGAGIPFLSTSTPSQTGTPTPTSTKTPTPTNTPTITPTLAPTLDHPAIPGIDTYVVVGPGVSLEFKKVVVTDHYYNPEVVDYHLNINPGNGQTWLVLVGVYKGDIKSVYWEGIKHPPEEMYLEDQAGQKILGGLMGVNPNTPEMFKAIIINKRDKGPFILRDTLYGWQVDLSLLPLEISPPTPAPIITARSTIKAAATRTPLPTNTP